ncbi:hypothetical protein LEP1GSC016_1350 [Leptospira borgpetersenii serovar Hardjo-bovis str. Sponselee]|uniref:Uncharacterized protein n=2 Tax=Leptospira borgpetersenii TaxID=174 RepID=M6BZU9_LEPBO|nr:hypothetical protein LEP1GSC016_1350 [Leptospira borgpetersenii serovar Hardjo-bovis str. Sponselee]EMO62578.1 hypothetical protein LEP1GSC133_1736 [Leptospira borgpetersenii serovar Pomona str. 200901868]
MTYFSIIIFYFVTTIYSNGKRSESLFLKTVFYKDPNF